MEGKTKNQSKTIDFTRLRSQRAKVLKMFGFAGVKNYRGTIDLQMAGEAAREKYGKSDILFGGLKPLKNLEFFLKG